MPAVATHSSRFDRVELRVNPGDCRSLSPREFEALPLDQRVRAILHRQLHFFRAGKEITLREALGGRS